jgi:hypothetical protein
MGHPRLKRLNTASIPISCQEILLAPMTGVLVWFAEAGAGLRQGYFLERGRLLDADLGEAADRSTRCAAQTECYLIDEGVLADSKMRSADAHALALFAAPAS